MASTSTPLSSDDRYNDSVYKFHEARNQPKKEVIFFHDILELSKYKMPHVETWMSGSSPSICWPGVWLSSEFPEARITSVRYDSSMWKTNTGGRIDPYRIAENLRQDILAIYKTYCPVFLVGHGVGGLVIKKVIHSMQEELGCNSNNQRLMKDVLTSFLENIKGVFFYDSPFAGIRLADYTKSLPQGTPLLKMIQTLDTETSRLNHWFQKWRKDRRCKTAAISASLPTKVALGYGSYWTFEVVKEASTRHDIDEIFYTSTKSDHFSICKPPNKTDNRFLMLVTFLQQESLPKNNGLPTEIKDSNVGPSTVPRNNGPPVQIEDNVASASVLLATILNQIAGLTPREAAMLKRADLEKIRRFPETERRLVEGLNKAGLTERRVFTTVERWSQM